jgi:hypothetical protein
MKHTRRYMTGMLMLAVALLVASCGRATTKEEPTAAATTPSTRTTLATRTTPATETTQTTAQAKSSRPTTPTTPPGQTTPTALPTPTTRVPPRIPHPLDGRDNCLMCHRTGIGKAPAVLASHAGRAIDQCRTCHQPR